LWHQTHSAEERAQFRPEIGHPGVTTIPLHPRVIARDGGIVEHQIAAPETPDRDAIGRDFSILRRLAPRIEQGDERSITAL
jgi:hypothetical protein